MGRLAGFRYRDIVKKLKRLGFQFHRQAAGSHEIWVNPATNRYTTIPNHPGTCPRVPRADPHPRLQAQRRDDPLRRAQYARWGP